MAESIYITPKKQGEKRREDIRDYMIQYISQNGYAPSVREIGAAVGLKSTSNVQAHLEKMYDTGMIQTDLEENRQRAYRVSGYRFAKDPDYDMPIPKNKTDKAIYNVIVEYILIHGYPPSFREIRDLSGMVSTDTVSRHIYAMVKNGLLKIGPRDITRAISVHGLIYVENLRLL